MRHHTNAFSALVAVALVAAVICISVPSNAQPCPSNGLAYTADFSKPVTRWEHFWETCLGSGHALLALRQDYREHLRRSHDELGVKYIRFHAIFDDDMSTMLDANTYSFYNLDNIYDYMLSIGVKPYVELSFMPSVLASGNSTVFHYKGLTSPPKSNAAWAKLITVFAQHLIERYGINEIRQWIFEVWNEPNLDFWTGTQQQYFELYNWTARALKAVDPKLRVGGPATAQSQWIPEFKKYVLANNIPIDFISTHLYPTDFTPIVRDVMKQTITRVVNDAHPYPVYYSEFNSGLYDPGFHDDPFAAAFLMYTLQDVQGLLPLLSYWTFSDVFEEGGFLSAPFHEGFGLITLFNIAKPAFRALELLHKTGTERVNVTLTKGSTPSAGTFVIRNPEKKGEIMVVVYNYNIPNAPIKPETVCVTLSGVGDLTGWSTKLERIDETHANPRALWVKLGSPKYPTKDQVDKMREASKLVVETVDVSNVGTGSYYFQVDIPPQAVAVVTISNQPPAF